MPLFCPTEQAEYSEKIDNPLIRLMSATVHGVVFDILIRRVPIAATRRMIVRNQLWFRRMDGGRTRDRTLDLSRVKGTLSR